MRFFTAGLCLFVIVLSGFSLVSRARAATRSEVPIHLYWNYLVVVRGSLGGMAKRNFIIDTGSNPSVVDRRIVRKLRLEEHTSKLHLLRGDTDSATAVLPEIQVGPISRASVPMTVQDLSFLERDLGVRIDALIGLDVLGQGSFGIDYSARKMTFESMESPTGEAAFSSGPPFVTVEMQMENRPLRLLVDTGAAGLILFKSRVGNTLREIAGAAAAGSKDLAGQMAMRQIQIASTRLGNLDLGARNAFLADDHGGGAEFDGLMGIVPLRVRQISFDFEHRLFRWQAQDSKVPNHAEADPAGCRHAGLGGAMSSNPASFPRPVDADDLGCEMRSGPVSVQ
jgi:predicted aspartyl protease